MYIAENEAILRNVLAAYDFPDTPIGVVRYGRDHCGAAQRAKHRGSFRNLYSGQVNP